MSRRLPNHRFHARAMTLFELAVVVTVAAVLAVLAVFSTGALVNRTKYSKVKEDHRVLTRALENYRMDYSALPGDVHLESLERPTAYIGSLPEDPFASQPGNASYVYLRPKIPGVAFVLISQGPDGDYDLPRDLAEAIGLVPARPGVGSLGGGNSDLNPMAVESAALSVSESDAEVGETGSSGALEPEEMERLGLIAPLTAEQKIQLAQERAYNRQREMNEKLQRYMKTRNWTPTSTETDGDIITIVRY
ncbi:MAG: hypothetical protein RLY93_17535 [Sumerlaeia bacterium]